MKRMRMGIILVTILMLVFCSFTLSFAVTEEEPALYNTSSFIDVENHWAQIAVEKWSVQGIIKGYEGKIRPDDSITRGEMAVILDNMMDYQVIGDNKFIDLLEDQFYTDAILKANKANIIKGDGISVRPLDKITREEATILMARAFGIEAKAGQSNFQDKEQISLWALHYVVAMEEAGYVKGYMGYFQPKSTITRAEAVTMINNLTGKYYTKEGTYTENIEGNAVIKVQDVVIKNATINGNLIIAEGVGSGDVTLDGVTVKGKLLVRGGGENSIHIEGNSKIESIKIEKVGDKLRVLIDDGITVSLVEVNIGEDIVISGSVGSFELAAAYAKIYVESAQINTVQVSGQDSTIIISGDSKVNKINVEKTGVNTSISAEKGAVVTTVSAEAKTSVQGEGNVATVELLAGANGSSITTPTTQIKVESSVTDVTGAGGEAIEEGTTVENNQDGTGVGEEETPIDIGGGGGGSVPPPKPTPTPNTNPV